MINFKCKNCGGELSVTSNGDLSCTYCGSKTVFTDKDLRDYKDFRYRLLSYLSAIADTPNSEETERIWENAEYEEHRLDDGRPLRISCLFKGVQDGVTVFTARRNVLFLFPEEAGGSCERYSEMISRLSYPSADIK